MLNVVGITWQEEMLFSIHNGIATLCACLPPYGHLIRRVAKTVSRIGKRDGFSKPASLQGLDDTKPLRIDPGLGTNNAEVPLGYQKSWKAEAQTVHSVYIQIEGSVTDLL